MWPWAAKYNMVGHGFETHVVKCESYNLHADFAQMEKLLIVHGFRIVSTQNCIQLNP
jgi:hypothetical protein